MDFDTPAPRNHTREGGVLVGSDNARRRLVVYEDPQCPYCRLFEESSGDMLRREMASGSVAVEYRIRCFLGGESVRAAGALALAAEDGGFAPMHQAVYAHQPPEGSGGFTADDLIALGASVGLRSEAFVSGVREGRYEDWAAEIDEQFQEEDPNGTPYALLDGRPLDTAVLYDPEALGALIRE